MLRISLLLMAYAITLSPSAFAHSSEAHTSSWWRATWDLWVVLPWMMATSLYIVGTVRLLRMSKRPNRLIWRSLSYSTGMVALAIALVSPIHWLGERLFTAHMIEHQLLMIVAPPLIVLGAPRGPLIWSLPQAWRAGAGALLRTMARTRVAQLLKLPSAALGLHASALWVWHVPLLYDFALHNERIHWLQHISFVITALVFWWTVFRRDGLTQYVQTLMILLTAMHTSVLGVLLTLAGRPVYPGQMVAAQTWGISELEDQQLAGLLMTLPGGFVYLLLSLMVLARALRASPQRSPQHQV